MNKKNNQIIKDDELNLKVFIEELWVERKQILRFIVIITFIGILYSFLVTPLYKSKVTMYPANKESGGNFSQLKGMASNLGLNIGGAETSFSIPDIVKSRRIKSELINKKWHSNNFAKPVDLIQYWEINNNNKISLNPINWIRSIFSDNSVDFSLIWQEEAINKLTKRISVNENKFTGLITIEILMEEPSLAADIVNAFYPEIIEFTVMTHAQQVKLNRQFIETRQKEVKIELKNAEDQLKEFRQRNRNVSESPELQLELERLLREVEIQTQVYITLQQQYEIARIEEVKETPSVIILDEADPPVYKYEPKRKMIGITSLLLGFIVGVGYVQLKRIFNLK